MALRNLWSKLSSVAAMQCVSCHYLCASGKGFPELGTLPQMGRNEIRRKHDFLQDEFELSCAKGVEEFSRLPASEVFDRVLSKRECEAYQIYNPSLTHDQMTQIEVQLPSLYKLAIILALVFALIADIGIAIAIWQVLQ